MHGRELRPTVDHGQMQKPDIALTSADREVFDAVSCRPPIIVLL